MSDSIDGNWIKARLTGRRGEKTALARALGIHIDQVSKLLSGERGVQPNEFIPLLRFFGLVILPVDTPDEARDVLADAASKLNHDGLEIARQQIAALASNPKLARPSEPQQQDT